MIWYFITLGMIVTCVIMYIVVKYFTWIFLMFKKWLWFLIDTTWKYIYGPIFIFVPYDASFYLISRKKKFAFLTEFLKKLVALPLIM